MEAYFSVCSNLMGLFGNNPERDGIVKYCFVVVL